MEEKKIISASTVWETGDWWKPSSSVLTTLCMIIDGLSLPMINDSYLIITRKSIEVQYRGILIRELLFSLETKEIQCYFEKNSIAIYPDAYNAIINVSWNLRNEECNPPLQAQSVGHPIGDVHTGFAERELTVLTAKSGVGKSVVTGDVYEHYSSMGGRMERRIIWDISELRKC